jgi:anaerobic dimethyl sulfoxide reductase subunit A
MMEEVHATACASHCGGTCLMKVHVLDGRITRIETDDGEEPQLRCCLRCRAYRQRVYAPDRIQYPLRRVGPRGKGAFERISWDEALDLVAGEIKRVKETYGPSAILLKTGGGDLTFVHGGGRIMERLLNLFGGHTGTWGSNSWEAATFASVVTYGTISVANTRDDLLNSRMILMWGWNPSETIQSTNTTFYLALAKEKGCRVVSVDPRYTDTTAMFADEWIPIKPSTDAAMLIAMAYVMVKENLHDQAFLDRYTLGFEKYKNYLLGVEDGVAKTPEWAEEITGVPGAAIAGLARQYATHKPAAFIAGIAPGRTAIGEQYHRAALTLAAMTGNVGIHGGECGGRCLGDQYPFHTYPFRLGPMMDVGDNRVDGEAPTLRIALKRYRVGDRPVPRSSARVHISSLADAILRGRAGGYPSDFKLLYVTNNNPVNQLPYMKKWVEALNKLEFMVVQEQFMTATARFADIIFPVATFLEKNDVIASGATPFYGYLKKVIEPVGETKSQLEIGMALARRLGIRDFNDKGDEELVKEIAGGSVIPDYKEFKEKGVYRIPLSEPYVAFQEQVADPEHHPFPTPSGKIEIYSEELDAMNDPLLPPIPKYFDPWEGPRDPLCKKYPLQLLTTHLKRRAHSQFETLPWLRELQAQTLMISTMDAAARGISDGDMVRVFNDRGEVMVPAKVTERIMPGVVDLPQGAWFSPDERGVDRGGCANVLTSDRSSPCGALVTNSSLVQVEKV